MTNHAINDDVIIRLGLNVALPHQNMSYRNSETKENVETQKKAERGKRQRQLKINTT